MPRFVVLEHVGDPDDPVGRHYDLLLEDGDSCRTWRLAAVPEPGGPAVQAVALTPHRLAWLDRAEGEVSGGRGFARRMDAGTYELKTPSTDTAETFAVTLRGGKISGELELRASSCLLSR